MTSLPNSIDMADLGAVCLDRGLTQAEVEARREEHGYNEVPRALSRPIMRFLSKFWGLTSWMLELIILLSVLLRRYHDLCVVSALLLVNAILSFVQEQRASGAVEALRTQLQVNARVLREGSWRLLPARELVPGDVLRLRTGDFVPADVHIAQGEVTADQSALTGESVEVDKGPGAMLYSGSVIRRGEATGVVALTGTRTYYGRTAELVQLARPRLQIEEVVSQVVRWLFVVVGALLAVALVFVGLKGLPLLDILPLLLVLLLGAVPVALPAMFTVSMALGSMELGRKGVLVTRLSASEDAATMSVLCVDKTGTITQNRLSVASVMPANGFAERDVILYGALASQEANHDPIDLAFLAEAAQRGLPGEAYVQTGFTSFDPETRRTEAVVQVDGLQLHVLKGAVNAIAEACGLGEGALRELEALGEGPAQKGHRILAVALAEDTAPPRLVGLATLADPLRPDSRPLIEELKGLGVAVKMLTGDALPIARQIAQQVGLDGDIRRAAELEGLAAADPMTAASVAERSDGFAEIYPEDKYLVVKSLQARGDVVGMTGDGVNDAPALRQAEVGIAVSSATDVAKSAASVVLTDEGLSGIVDLVKNGRMIHQRIATWIVNKISRTILKSSFIVFAFLITGKFVVSAFAIMLMMFMTDFVKISLSTDNARWSREPETWDVVSLVKVAVVLGVIMAVESLVLLYLGLTHLGLAADDQALYTFSYQTLFYFAMFSIFVVRERAHFWSSRPSRTLLLAITVDIIVGTLISTVGIPGLQPLPLSTTLFVLGYAALFSLVVNDLVKYALACRVGLTW